MDRISSLPDELICHIVSFLSAKEAAFTTVLKKRWQNLFHIIPNLEYDDINEHHGSFTEFLDGVLTLPASSRIRKFSLKCGVDPFHYAHINRSLRDVLKRGVLDLNLDIYVLRQYSLPFEVFTCKSVVVMKLGTNLVIDVLPKNAFLPVLETLILNSVRFKDLRGCAFHALLSACRVLKELTIRGVNWESWKWSRTVSSPTLHTLTVKRLAFNGFDGSDYKSISFDTPNLICLQYEDFVPGEYPAVELDSLVEAKLDLVCTRNHTWERGYANAGVPVTSNPTNLFKGLRNVEIMSITTHDSFETFNLFRKAIPVFKNLCHLSVTPYGEEFCVPSLPILLKKSPNLKTLVIEGPLHVSESERLVCECMSEYSCLLSCPVEVLEIKDYMGSTGEMEQMKHFLGKLSCLRLVKIGVWESYSDKEKLGMTTDLLMLPRASSKCKIKVEFD